MKLLPSILTFVLASSGALAQNVSPAISAGEHGFFSRIVVSRGGTNIEVVQSGRQVKLYNVSNPSALNLHEINLLRKAHRVLQAEKMLTNGGGYIELTLACDCQVEAAPSYDGKFVIDVKPKEQEEFGRLDNSQANNQNTIKTEFSRTTIDEDRMTVAQARDRMVSLLQQAADNGLISIQDDEQSPLSPAEPAREPFETATPETIGEHIVLASDIKEQSTREETHETTEDPVEPEKIASAPASNCLNDQVLAIKSGKFEEAPLVQITEIQGALADATGTDRERLTHELIAGFLSIGFGDEAFALLRDQGQENSPLADISRIISERPVDPNGRLLSAKDCSGAHALWQAAAETSEQAVQKVIASENAIEDLPSRLQSMIATRLAAKLIEAKAWKEAEALIEIARASASTDDPALAFVEAQLLAYEGDTHEARKSLREIAAQNSTSSKDALLSLAESYEKNEAPYHDGFIEDIGAQSKIEGSLSTAIAEAIAWANVGNYGAAMLILRNESTKSAAHGAKARETAFKILNRGFDTNDEATIISALDAYLENDDWISSTLWSPEWRRDLAKIIERIGLPNLALILLDETPVKSTDLDLERTRAALSADKPETAISIAAAHAEEPSFATLIVQSNIKLKRYFAALASAKSLGDEQEKAKYSAKAAWLGRDWKSAAASFQARDPGKVTREDAIQFALAAYRADEENLPAAVDAVLAKEAPSLLGGVKSLFSEKPRTGSAVERTQEIVDRTNAELELYEEVLSDG